MHWKVLLVLIAVEIVYLVVGGLIFWGLESTPSRDSSTDDGSNDADSQTTVNATLLLERINNYFAGGAACISKLELTGLVNQTIALESNSSTNDEIWSLPGSVFFAMTVVTTIGYGTIVPTTSGSKAFCCCYALFGIPLTLGMLMGVGEKLNQAADYIEKKVTKKSKKSARFIKVVKSLVMFVVGMVCFLLIPAAVFSAIQSWSYGTGVYYGIITLTSVGFGDYVAAIPRPEWMSRGWAGFYRISVGIWIFIGLAWLSGLISSLQETFKDAFERIDKKGCCCCTKRAPEDAQTEAQTAERDSEKSNTTDTAVVGVNGGSVPSSGAAIKVKPSVDVVTKT